MQIVKTLKTIKRVIVNVIVYVMVITFSVWAVSATVYNIVYQSEISNKKTQMLEELYKYVDEFDFSIIKSGQSASRSITKSMYITFSTENIPQDLVVQKVVEVLGKNGYKVNTYSNISTPSITFESEKYLLSFGIESKKNNVWQLTIRENTFLSRGHW